MRKICRYALTLLASAMLVQVTVGTAPATPPYGQYFIRGKIARPGGLPLRNYVVTLLVKLPLGAPPDTLLQARPFRQGTLMDQYPAVTDSTGEFYLVVATVPQADSIALEVNGVGQPTVRGPVLPVPEDGIPVTVTYTADRPGCSDCSSNPSARDETKGYQYYLPDQTIDLGS